MWESFPCPFGLPPSPPMVYSWIMTQHDDVNETITEAVERHVQPGDRPPLPITVIGPLPAPQVEAPPRDGRTELHITAPQEARTTPSDGLPAQAKAPRPKALDEALPIFQATGEALGWEAFSPGPEVPDPTPAMRSIYAYSAQSIRQICQVTEQARSELLWERSREYDQAEAAHRARYPLTRTVRM